MPTVRTACWARFRGSFPGAKSVTRLCALEYSTWALVKAPSEVAEHYALRQSNHIA